jgi:predicted membrane channel-forming protein YqfA (hemolysin III family)
MTKKSSHQPQASVTFSDGVSYQSPLQTIESPRPEQQASKQTPEQMFQQEYNRNRRRFNIIFQVAAAGAASVAGFALKSEFKNYTGPNEDLTAVGPYFMAAIAYMAVTAIQANWLHENPVTYVQRRTAEFYRHYRR